MLKHYHLVVKIGVDTAENEPFKSGASPSGIEAEFPDPLGEAFSLKRTACVRPPGTDPRGPDERFAFQPR